MGGLPAAGLRQLWGKLLPGPRSLALQYHRGFPAPTHHPPPSDPAFSSQARPSPHRALRGNYGGGFHPRKGGNTLGECLGRGIPAIFAGGGGRREEEMDFTVWRRHLDSQLLEGRESKRGILGGFPGTRSSRGGSPCLHTPVTMTVQPQPPVSMAAASAKRLVSFLFLPGLRPITPHPPTQHSPSVQGEGQLRRRRPLRHSWAREGRQESRNWRAEL